ncbi:MAG: hypothetical protein FWH10_03110 [Oscillospiraceae bacterium]|nr:hypothetical protein [Oscillospiraceae bacterium]
MNNSVSEEKKRGITAGTVMRWIIYLICVIILGSVIFRTVSMRAPGELKNYIIGSESVANAYIELGESLGVYKISVRNPFSGGDALFADNIYYIERAENLQLTLRFKTSRLDGGNLNVSTPFRAVLKVSGDDSDSEDLFGAVDIKSFGRETARYRYFVYAFDNIKIDYANTKIELYIYLESDIDTDRNPDEIYGEISPVGRFTLFDVNMPKSEVRVKDLNIR